MIAAPQTSPNKSAPNADSYQPVLTWRSHAWRYAICLAVSGFVWFAAWVQPEAEIPVRAFAADWCGGALAFGLSVFRRRWPLPIAILTGALTAISATATGPATLSAVSLATRRVVWQVALTGIVAYVAGLIFNELIPGSAGPLWMTLTFNAIIAIAMLGWGMFIGSRRELLWTFRDRALRAEAEQDLRVASARAAERARIAREMHDVLAHKVSQVSMFAGALAYRDNLDPSELRKSAAIIQAKANEALADLRGVLGVLRDSEGVLLDRPQPTHSDLSTLVAESVALGMTIDFDDDVAEPSGLDPRIGRSTYRIVQEGLTNARKHAPGAKVQVTVAGDAERGVDVTVRNRLGFHDHPAVPGAGLGLVGLRERAELSGGQLNYRLGADEFVLHAWLPWSA